MAGTTRKTTTPKTKTSALTPVPTPRSPGFTCRAARVERAREQLREQVRRELVASGEIFTEADIETIAVERLGRLLRDRDSDIAKQYDKTAPTSRAPRRDLLFEKVEVAAIRRTDEAAQLEEQLSGAGQPRGRGRPSDRRLPIAVFERNTFEMGRPEVRANVRDFMGSDALLDWAYQHPVHGSTCGVHERSVLDTMQAMLDRHDPNAAIALNLAAIRKLGAQHPDVGRYVAIDGTDVPAWLDQAPDYSAAHKRVSNRGMTGAAFGTHGRHFWRGYTLLVLTDLKTTLPLAWILTPANEPESGAVTRLMDLLYMHWPQCPIEYLVGDRGFDVPGELHRDLEECYGIHLVTPWKSNGSDGQLGDLGTPYCHCTGEGKPMTLKQSDNFIDAAKRRAAGIEPGVRIYDPKKLRRHRWFCSNCGTKGPDTYFHKDPRRHCYLPREGEHAWRVNLRIAMLLRRNAGESLFALIKHRGVAGRGVNVPRWVRSDNHVRWLTGTCLLGLTLRRLVHENGSYQDVHQEAVDASLVKLTGKAGMGRAGLAPAPSALGPARALGPAGALQLAA